MSQELVDRIADLERKLATKTSTNREPIGVLAHGLMGRTRKVGVDENGLPMEETVPARAGLAMYDRDGSRVYTATSCHRARLKTAEANLYRSGIIRQLLEEGFLREDMCPHVAVAYDDKPPKPTVPAPAGFTGCKGALPYDPVLALGGCQCLRDIVNRRRIQAKDKARVRKSLAADARTLQLTKQMAQAQVEAEKNQPQTASGMAEVEKARRARRGALPEVQGTEG